MWEDVQIVWGTLAVVLLVFASPHADLTLSLRCWSNDLALAAVLPFPVHRQNCQCSQPAAGAGSRPACLLSPRAFLLISKQPSQVISDAPLCHCFKIKLLIVSVVLKPGPGLLIVTESASALDNNTD